MVLAKRELVAAGRAKKKGTKKKYKKATTLRKEKNK